MTQTLPIKEAASRLEELVSRLLPGDEIRLTAQDRSVARIIAEPAPKSGPPYRRGGACKGMLTVISEDEDHLAEFKGYMP
jgi:antitoxin (DNA-binding transcriptional repressor) of toxin-antitoxin stability system